jgi:hypothetical protein
MLTFNLNQIVDGKALCQRRTLWGFILAFGLLVCGWGSGRTAHASDQLTESQVKALCLLNFAKYVSWTNETAEAVSGPIRIGVIGQSKLSDDLKAAAKGKSINQRSIEIVEFSASDNPVRSHILFIGDKRPAEILDKVKNLPVLTVGENDSFSEAGGMIRFVVRQNKVRFEVDLAATRRAGLQVSSKLLNLADKVHGK